MIGLVAACLRWPDRQSGQGAIPIDATKDCSTVVARAVLICMAEHANAHHITYPSAETIARETGLSVRAVKRAKALLETHGYLEVVGLRSGGGPGSSTRYRVAIGQATATNHDEPDTVVGANCDAPDTVKGTNGQLEASNYDGSDTGDECGHNCAATGHNCDECGQNYVAPDTRTSTNPQEPAGSDWGVGDGGAQAPSAGATGRQAPGEEERAAPEEEHVLDTILAALPHHGVKGTKLLPVIRAQLDAGISATQVIAAATSGPTTNIHSWTQVLTSRIENARWFQQKPAGTDNPQRRAAERKPQDRLTRHLTAIAAQTVVLDRICDACRMVLDVSLRDPGIDAVACAIAQLNACERHGGLTVIDEPPERDLFDHAIDRMFALIGDNDEVDQELHERGLHPIALLEDRFCCDDGYKFWANNASRAEIVEACGAAEEILRTSTSVVHGILAEQYRKLGEDIWDATDAVERAIRAKYPDDKADRLVLENKNDPIVCLEQALCEARILKDDIGFTDIDLSVVSVARLHQAVDLLWVCHGKLAAQKVKYGADLFPRPLTGEDLA